MVKQIFDRGFMLRHMNTFGQYLDQETQVQNRGDARALDRARQAGVTPVDMQQAKVALIQAQSDPKASEIREGQQAFLPPHATASALQTSLQTHLLERRPDLLGSPGDLQPANDAITDLSITGTDDTDNLFQQFGPLDIGWISVGFALLVKLFRSARTFTPNPAPFCTISNTARLILIADWGTGVPRARLLTQSARHYLDEAAKAGTEVHVIHLGDVYYSGFGAEYDAHFLPFWPVHPEEAGKYGSWCLNGNHDMYSGGHGYFDHLLKDDPRFARQAQSSYFSLENDFWHILALDTAYSDFDLHGDQSDWVLRTRSAAPAKKGILLSHHQPFSSYEPAPDTILKRLQPVLERDLILGWFWGHEHRCAFYQPRSHVQYGRCIGHGGVPVLAPSAPMPAGVSYEFGDWVVGTDPHFARFGFSVIDCANQRMHVQYVMEDGIPHNEEDFTSAASAASTD
jgi:Calcineurin-like phosphoesterase